jgi:hypothetical protein
VADPSLFHGIAMLIDDDIVDADAGIRTIQTQLEAEGCHVVQMSGLPTKAGLPNLRGFSFFVLDWNLYGRAHRDPETGLPLPVPEQVKAQNTADVIDFLKRLKTVCVAPVFIFTDEIIEEVEEEIKQHAELHDPTDPSHILVRSKKDVSDSGIFNVLSEWMKKAPSVYVLKKWERTYEAAKTQLFLDFYHNSVHWPLVMWTTYKQDNVDASVELGNLIGRNLLSRMTPFHFDLEPFQTAVEAIDAQAGKGETVVLKVLEGERFLKKVQADSIAPGDVFTKGGEYFINIRPDCDCIARDGEAQDDVKMYLLRGNRLKTEKIAERVVEKTGTISERDTETIIFGMTDGITVCFQFKALLVEEWKKWKDRRIGRLLPPYLTRLQQRYSAYLQRPGLTKIPKVLLPPPPAAKCAATLADQAPIAPAQTIPVAAPTTPAIETAVIADTVSADGVNAEAAKATPIAETAPTPALPPDAKDSARAAAEVPPAAAPEYVPAQSAPPEEAPAG